MDKPMDTSSILPTVVQVLSNAECLEEQQAQSSIPPVAVSSNRTSPECPNKTENNQPLTSELETPSEQSTVVPSARAILPSRSIAVIPTESRKLSDDPTTNASSPKKQPLLRFGVSFETLKDASDSPSKARNPRLRSATVGSLAATTATIEPKRPSYLGSLPNLSMGDLIIDPESRQNLKAHKSSVLHQPYLTFWDQATENAYRDVFLGKVILNWKIFAVIGIVAMLVFEIAFATSFTNRLGLSSLQQNSIFAGVFGFLPLCTITLIGHLAPCEWLKNHIHTLSSLYIIVIGPILICGRYFVMDGQYDAVTAPFYITQLFFFTFFFHLRFIHTVLVILISVPIWFGVFGKALSLTSLSDPRSSLLFVWSGVSLFVASIVICSMSYVIERNSRLQYISDKQYLAINTKLHKQLKGLQSAYETRFADLESPLEKALYGLRVLLASPSVTAEQLHILTIIQACLNSSNLMAPDLYHQVKRGEVIVDDEQEKWLFNEIAAGINGRVDANGIRSPENDSEEPHLSLRPLKSPGNPSFTSLELRRRSGSGEERLSTSLNRGTRGSVPAQGANDHVLGTTEKNDQNDESTPGTNDDSLEKTTDDSPPNQNLSAEGENEEEESSLFNDEEAVEEILGLVSPEADSYLNQIDDYNFPLFELSRITTDRPLSPIYYRLIVNSGLLDRLQLPINKFARFICAIEKGYDSSLSFHNAIHAADVLHCIYHLTQLDRCKGIFSDMEILAIYTAAAIHDFDHPGVNNNFLIATGDKRAMLYNDKSVLENHHCAAAFEVLLTPENHFLEGFDKKTYRAFRTHVVDMVLATDLAQHFSLLTNFKKKAITGDNFDPVSSLEDRTCLMQMLMKCADVSNPTKQWPLYEKWIDRITEEFFNQGDKEKALGLPISPFCNRDSPNTFSCQKGFIEFIVSPLFEALESWTSLGVMKDGLDASRERFCPPPPTPSLNASGNAGATTSSPGTNNNSTPSHASMKRGRMSTEDAIKLANSSQLSSSAPNLPDRSKSPQRTAPPSARGRRSSIAANLRASLSLLTTNTGSNSGSLSRSQSGGLMSPRSASVLSPPLPKHQSPPKEDRG